MNTMNANDALKHRKGSKTIQFLGKDGLPIGNSEVSIKQTKHAFLFGCTAFSALQLTNNEFNDVEKTKSEEDFKLFFELFNFVTMPFYWGRFEPEKGCPDTKRVKTAVEWLVNKGCVVKGHPLCWHTVTAPWLMEMSNKDILTTQLNRIRRDVTDFEGLIDMWDVINEVVIMPIFDKYDNGITRICKELGRIRTVREVFQAAKKANPNATLLLNDFWTDEAYDILIEGCLESGIPIDAIGIQSHMHQGYWGEEKTQEILDRYSRFKLPLHFTENTLVSGKIMPREIVDLNDYVVDEWPSTPDGLIRQAEEITRHYKTLFADPNIASITYWGFEDGGWLKAPSGFITKEGAKKPSYDALHKLIRDEWWTKSSVLLTDDLGYVTVNGFLGDYEAICKDEKTSFSIK